ncbi:MAG: hypothetical protein LIO92_02935 [Clostridiales bacterium]|nr:hypothetical protein [Clostridiales bacterium]
MLQMVALIAVSLTCCASNWETEASQTSTDNENNILLLSEKTVKITCGDAEATFQLYNSWNFTRLGEFQNINQKELKELFGTGGITAVLSR